ncbi:hypothetical protein QBC36DRAFT_311347 [Triangularia setosa]|uniref:Uncharacterized protein n=1 Tax=Triangularia setosa TaxID=2587417 RepID=A0AAN6W8P4_9PEZI|nr:hypothetical protein QBC36DRAFT_311347 [Podospora setosa]
MEKGKEEDGALTGLIMERKIPRRSHDTFASNLGRKVSPATTPQAVAKGHTKSVKSLTKIYEKAAAAAISQSSSNLSNLSIPSSSSTTTLNWGKKAPEVSPSSSSLTPTPTPSKPRRLRGPFEPDDEDLTLLEYKQYMTNRPLGRCLDDLESLIKAIASSSSQAHHRKPLSQEAQAANEALDTLDRCFPPLDNQPAAPSEPEPSPISNSLERAPDPPRTKEEAKAYWDATRNELSTSWDELEPSAIYRPPSFVLSPPPSPRPPFSPSSPLLRPIIEEQEDELDELYDQYQRDEEQYQECQPEEEQPDPEQQHSRYQVGQEEQYHKEQEQPPSPCTLSRRSHHSFSPSVHNYLPSWHQILSPLSPIDVATAPKSSLRPPLPPTRPPPPPPPQYLPPPPPIQLSPPKESPNPGAFAHHQTMKSEQFLKKHEEHVHSPYDPESENYIEPEITRAEGQGSSSSTREGL